MAATQILMNSTGVGTFPHIIEDKGSRPVPHPTVNEEVQEEWSPEEFRDSASLKNAVVSGHVTFTFNGIVIDDGTKYDRAFNLDNAQVDQNTTDISTLTGASHTQNTDTKLDEGGANEITAATIKAFVDSKGQINGLAELDASGKVPTSQLPSVVLGGIKVIGFWDAATNTPDLGTLTPNQGEAYQVSVAGSTNINGETNWKVKDLVVWDDNLAGNWFKLDNTDDVLSVNGQTGAVTLNSTHINHTQNDPSDWTVADGSSTGAHLDEVGDRLTTLEAAPPTIKKSWSFEVGDDKVNGDTDLMRSGDSKTTTNKSPIRALVDSTIWGISVSSEDGVTEDYDIQIIVNGVVQFTQPVAGDGAVSNILSISVSAGDKIRVRFIKGSTGNVKDLNVIISAIEV